MPYTIQGQDVTISTEPILDNGKHYIPLREIVEVLGGEVTFDEETKQASAIIGPWTANVQPESTEVTVVGEGQTVPVTITAAPVIADGTFYVPFDFLRDAFGYNVRFEDETVHIDNPNV